MDSSQYYLMLKTKKIFHLYSTHLEAELMLLKL